MIEYPEITFEILLKHKGEYIQVEGHGVADGLKYVPDKMLLYRIEGLHLAPDGEREGVWVHAYRKRKHDWLPSRKFNQKCRIYTKEEWKKMPVYSGKVHKTKPKENRPAIT